MKTDEERQHIRQVAVYLRQTAARLCKSVREHRTSARDNLDQLAVHRYRLRELVYQLGKIQKEYRYIKAASRKKEIAALVSCLQMISPCD